MSPDTDRTFVIFDVRSGEFTQPRIPDIGPDIDRTFKITVPDGHGGDLYVVGPRVRSPRQDGGLKYKKPDVSQTEGIKRKWDGD